MFRVYLRRWVVVWRDWSLVTVSFPFCLTYKCVGFILGSGKEMRGVPLPKSSFLPPSLHSKPMTSGVSGGRDQPIGVELRTELSLSLFCCSGRSATKESCCGLIPINLPRAEACKHCHRTVRPLVESSGTVGVVTPQCWGVWSEF